MSSDNLDPALWWNLPDELEGESRLDIVGSGDVVPMRIKQGNWTSDESVS